MENKSEPQEIHSTAIRHSARAILLDETGQLILIMRTKPGQDPYWTTPGGGVEELDTSLEATLIRELHEELGATISHIRSAFSLSTKSSGRQSVQHFFIAQLDTMDEAIRSGTEFTDPSRGDYLVVRVPIDDNLGNINIRPSAVKDFILTNIETLLT